MGSPSFHGQVTAGPLPEADWDEPTFQRWVVATARANGHRVRVMDQRGRPGWRGQATDRGLPDLLLVRDEVIWMELKAKGGKLRPDQEIWIAALRAANSRVYVFDPTQWEELLQCL